MLSVSPRGKALLLLLAALSALPWSLAAAPRRAAHPRVAAQAPAPEAPLAFRFGNWLRSFWGKEGVDIDPNGRAAVRPAPGQAGGTAAGNTADEGLNIHPNG